MQIAAYAPLDRATFAGSGASVGCIGNRVYTGLADDELYLAVPAAALEATLGRPDTILNANAQLEAFHRLRAAALS